MNIAQKIVTEVEDVFSRHAPEIEAATEDVAKVASNPLVRIMMAAVHVPPSSLERVALLIEQLEADFAKAQPSTIPAAPDPAPPSMASTGSIADTPALLTASAAVSVPTGPAADPAGQL